MSFYFLEQIMKPFSLIANFDRLLKPSKTNEFSVINGIKVIAIFQVVIGHRMFLEMGNPQTNPEFLYSVSDVDRMQRVTYS